jgi:hypothetical protein
MRSLVIAIAVTAVLGLGGAFAWRAEAANPSGAFPPAAQLTPIHKAACVGYGGYCPPGRHRVCGPYGYNCWCAPC